MGLPLARYRSVTQDNCAISLIEYRQGQAKPLWINSVSHLGKEEGGRRKGKEEREFFFPHARRLRPAGIDMNMKIIGVISDTHGLVRPEALGVLRDCALILHAGDVGSAEALAALQSCRPVLAVRGNVDRGLWAAELPETRLEEIDGTHVLRVARSGRRWTSIRSRPASRW